MRYVKRTENSVFFILCSSVFAIAYSLLYGRWWTFLVKICHMLSNNTKQRLRGCLFIIYGPIHEPLTIALRHKWYGCVAGRVFDECVDSLFSCILAANDRCISKWFFSCTCFGFWMSKTAWEALQISIAVSYCCWKYASFCGWTKSLIEPQVNGFNKPNQIAVDLIIILKKKMRSIQLSIKHRRLGSVQHALLRN